MKLSEVISLAKYSELSSLSIKNDNDAITSFINLGLLAIYELFPIRTEEFVIELQDNVAIYDLPADFMYLTGAYEAPDYNSEAEAKQLPINEEKNPYSVNTINFKQVQVPLTMTGTYVSIIYVAKPTLLTAIDLTVEVPIPDQLVQCLLLFIAAKAHSAVRLDGQTSEGDVYYSRFKKHCAELKASGTSIASDDLSMDCRIYDRGFP